MSATVMIQIRNVPQTVHRVLKARAAQAGMSLSEYLLREVRRSAEVPSQEELFERLRSRPPVLAGLSAAQVIREGREERELAPRPRGRKRA